MMDWQWVMVSPRNPNNSLRNFCGKILHQLRIMSWAIELAPVSGGGRKAEPEIDRLSNILKTFNEHFGTTFADTDRVMKRLTQDIAPKVAASQEMPEGLTGTVESRPRVTARWMMVCFCSFSSAISFFFARIARSIRPFAWSSKRTMAACSSKHRKTGRYSIGRIPWPHSHGIIFIVGSLHGPWPAAPIAATRNQTRWSLVKRFTVAVLLVTTRLLAQGPVPLVVERSTL